MSHLRSHSRELNHTRESSNVTSEVTLARAQMSHLRSHSRDPGRPWGSGAVALGVTELGAAGDARPGRELGATGSSRATIWPSATRTPGYDLATTICPSATRTPGHDLAGDDLATTWPPAPHELGAADRGRDRRGPSAQRWAAIITRSHGTTTGRHFF